MDSAPSPLYTFGAYRLDPQERLLLRDGQAVPLSPKAFDMLLVLVRHSGRVVEKDRLLKEVWPDTFVEEGNLTVHMSALRKALGDSESSSLIETVPRRGYRFLLPVEQFPAERASLVMERRVETRIVREEIEEGAAIGERAWRYLVLAAVVLLMTAALTWRFAMKAGPPPAALRITPFASYPGGVYGPSFAPDGERIAFSWTGTAGGNWDIYAKVIGNDPPLRLTTDEGSDGFPTWSPDGRQIAFLRGGNQTSAIYVVGAMGGGERKLADVAFGRYFDLEWSTDGRSIVFAQKTDPREPYNSNRSLAIFVLSVNSLDKRQLTFPKDPQRDDRFSISGDGSRLAFLRHDNAGSAIMQVPLDGGQPTAIHREANWIGHVAWTADDNALIFSSVREGGSKLFRVPATGGVPEMLPFGEAESYFPAIARRGARMAFVRTERDADLYRMELTTPRGPSAKIAALPSGGRTETAPEFSPDGRRLAFFSEGSGRRELWLSDADGANAAPLTDFHASTTFAPGWSPSGRELVFASLHGPAGSKGGVFVINVDTRELRRLSDDAYSLPWWSRDGQGIYLAASPLFTSAGIWKIPAQGGDPIHVTSSAGIFAQESTDGRMLYYIKLTKGIWKMPLTGGVETEVIAGFPPAARGCWRVTQDGIYSWSAGAFEFQDFSTGQRRLLARHAQPEDLDCGGMTVSPDRRSIVFSQNTRSSNEIVLVENFR